MAPTTPKAPDKPNPPGSPGGKKAAIGSRPVKRADPPAAPPAAAPTPSAAPPAPAAKAAGPAAGRSYVPATPSQGQPPAYGGQLPGAATSPPTPPAYGGQPPGVATHPPTPPPYGGQPSGTATHQPTPPAYGGQPPAGYPPTAPTGPTHAPATGPGSLDLYAYRHVLAAGAAAGCETPQPVPGVKVTVTRAGYQLGTEVTTNRDGHAVIPDLPPGWALVEATARVEDENGHWLRSSLSGPFWVEILPDHRREVRLLYLPSTTDLQVSAFFEHGEGQHAVPLAGVICELEAQQVGGVAGGHTVTRKLVLEDIPGIFEDVEEGAYVLAFRGPTRFRGHAIEMVDPANARQTLVLQAGAATCWPPVHFRRALGRVEGQVYDTLTRQGCTGIAMLLSAKDGWRCQATTGDNGDFEFAGVPAGAYRLGFASSKYVLDGCTLAPAAGSETEIEIQVETGRPLRVRDFALERDRHLIILEVLLPDGNPAAFAEITVLDELRNQVCTCNADESGHLEVELERAGTYILVPTIAPDGLPQQGMQVTVNSIARPTLQLRPAGQAAGSSLQAAASRDKVLDVPYPLLTESTSFPAAPPSGPGGGAQAVTALGQAVDSTLRTVLGWRPRTTDPRGFLAALNQAFTFVDVEGRRDFTWRQTTYAMQPDMGAITGAQASIYTRAKAALDQSVPLLDGLKPLRPDADLEAAEAIRSVVRSEFTALVQELGAEGGPRVQRVSSLFSQLLGKYKGSLPADPENVDGQLKQLRDEFGLTRNRVNTVDDEQNLTNFLILVDYVNSLNQSWEAQRRFFDRGPEREPFLGTQLVLVSRALAVLAESVQEIYFVMDSVFLGDAERQFVELQFAGEPLTIAELLTWVETVATQEGPQLIQEGGKTGVIALQPTIDTLATLASQALIQHQDPRKQLPASYQTARVQRSMQQLAEHLGETRSLIQNFKPNPVEA